MTSERSATEEMSRAIEPVTAALTASANALLDSLVRAPARDVVGDEEASPVAPAHRLFRDARDTLRALPLPGAHVLIDALDALFGQLRRQRREPDRVTALAVTDAYQALLGHLGEAAAGARPAPMRLYAYYADVARCMDQQPAPRDLFFPDISPLAELPAPSGGVLDAAALRAAFDKALLPFMRDGGAQHLVAMRDVAATVAGALEDPAACAGWRVLHAFIDNAAMETAASPASPSLDLKRLLGAINTRLRHLGEPVPDTLLRAVLYHLAEHQPLAASARMIAATLGLAEQLADRDARRYDNALDYAPVAPPQPEPAAPPAPFAPDDMAIDFTLSPEEESEPAPPDADATVLAFLPSEDEAPETPPSAAALDDFLAASDRAVLQLCDDLAQWRAAPDRPAVLQAIAHLQGMREGAAGVGCAPLQELALALEMVLRSIPEHPAPDLIGPAQLDTIGRAVEAVSGMLQSLATGAPVRGDGGILLELAALQLAVEKAALSPFSAQTLDAAADTPAPAEPEIARAAMLGEMADGLAGTLAALMAEGEHRLDAGPAAPDVAPAPAARDDVTAIEDHFEPVQLGALVRNGGARLQEIGQNLKAWRQSPADQAYAARLVAQLQALHEAARAAGALRLAFAMYEIEIQIEMYLDTSGPGDNAPSALFDSLLAHYAECTQLFEQLPR